MLVNKLILEYGYMFVRSTDPKYLKYVMDLGVSPLVVDCINNTIISLFYIRLNPTINYGNTFDLPNIRPLTILEIKNALMFISRLIHIRKDYKFYLWQTFFVHFPQTYIDRNVL